MAKRKRISDKEKRMCLGKIKHKSIISADFILNNQKSTPANVTLGVYQCDYCKHYHIGHDHMKLKHETK